MNHTAYRIYALLRLILHLLPVCKASIIFIFLLLNDTLQITAMKQSGVESPKIVKTTINKPLPAVALSWKVPAA